MFDMIPQGWKIVELSEIADGDYGIVDGPFGSNLKVSDYIDDSVNGVPVLTTKNLNGDYSKDSVRYISKEKFDSLKRSAVTPGDIIVAKIGSIGKCGIYPLDQRIALIPANLLKITPKSDVNRKYVFYYIQSAEFQKRIKSIATATAQPAFNVTKFRKLPIPIPSLPEQNRIVARIEELFSELDNGVETLRKTKQQLDVYRQAVLKAAFGENTQDGYRPLRTVLSSSPQNGLYKPKTAYGSGIRILRIDGFYDGRISDDYDFKRLALSESEIKQYQLNKWDLVINRVNSMPYLGKCALVRDLAEVTVYESNMMRMRLDENTVDPEYVTHYLSSFIGRKELTKNAKQAVNQASINQTDVGNALIPVLKSLEEQRNVVSEINARMSVCDNIEKTVDTALQQAEAMRQSILKQAFEGEL